MKQKIATILSCILLLSTNEAFSGVRGYKVLFIDLTPQQQFKPTFIKYRTTTSLQKLSHCWGKRKGEWIDIAYVNTQPINVTQETIKLAAAGNDAHVKEFSRRLKSYRDDEITAGFDGAYIVKNKGAQVVVTGLSQDATILNQTILSNSTGSLDQSLCAAAAAFDKSFNP